MGFTFEAPTSISTSAYDKAHRRPSPNAKLYALPATKHKRTSTTPLASSSSSFLGNLKQNFRKPFRRSSEGGPISCPSAPPTRNTPSVAATDSPFFRLSLPLREKTYGYVIGRDEVLHILLKKPRKSASSSPSSESHSSRYTTAYRRCRARGKGKGEDCISAGCKEFLDIAQGVYFGNFDSVSNLLLTCRDISKEALRVLYTQTVFDFDAPLSLLLFSSSISPVAFNSIRDISITPHSHLYSHTSHLYSHTSHLNSKTTSFHPDQWSQMWQVISQMQGLENINVRFRGRIEGWCGWNEKEALAPLWMVTRPVNVFDVEATWSPFTDVEKDLRVDEDGREAPFRLLAPGERTVGR